MTTFLTVCVIVALVAAVVLVSLWQSTVVLLTKEKAAHEQTNAALVALTKSNADNTSRLEVVIATLKVEIATLEGDLNACRDPAVVRSRLRSLLSSAVTNVAPGGGLPPGGTSP